MHSKNPFLYLLLFIFCVVHTGSFAQTTYQKAFGNENGGQLNSVIIMDDGNYAFFGWLDVQTLFTAEFYLLLSNPQGDTIYTRTYGARVDSTVNRRNGNGNEGFHAIQTMDGGFVLSGERHEEVGGTSDVFIVKTSPSGVLEWSKTYGDLENEYGFAIRELNDGSFAVGGFTESYGAGGRDFYLLKLNSEGDTLWTRTYGGASLDLANDMRLTDDGGFILAGYTFSFGAGNSDAFVVKTDSLGNIDWQYAYGGTENDLVHGIASTIDGGYILVGETESFGSAGSDLYLIKIDLDGQLQWSKTLGGELSEFGNAIIETTSGDYVIAGSTESFGASGLDGYLVRVDNNGDFLWSHNYGSEFDEKLNDVKESEDGGFIVCGDTRTFGAGNQDAYIIKTDSLGRSVCHQSASEYFSVNVNTEINLSDAELHSGTALKRLSTLTGFTNTTQTDLCEGPVSTYDLITNENITVFPNPTSENIQIKTSNHNNIVYIEIFDLNGKQIILDSLRNHNPLIDISHLPSGIYILKTHTNLGIAITKFVKI